MYLYHMNQNLINNSIISFEKYNFFNIFNSNDVSYFYSSIKKLNTNNDFLLHYKRFGSNSIKEILKIHLGEELYYTYTKNIKNKYKSKYDYIIKYCSPYNFKILDWNSKNYFKEIKHISRNKIIEDYMLVENSDTCECYDIKRVSQNFWLRVYGIKVVFQIHEKKQTLIFNTVYDDILLESNNITLKDHLIYTKEELLNNEEFVLKDILMKK